MRFITASRLDRLRRSADLDPMNGVANLFDVALWWPIFPSANLDCKNTPRPGWYGLL
ncbi:hypothetical protein [Desulfosarcina ovata]|uniref:Uncharacterized protein n=1 Tax=Desulfosarcina ovata subsp. ovata TaxID=2752305 RepID=A0A5K8AIE0_9BACT|nr:hypothetical protein [Desulfosarcina ovata]BBO92452.1 hypothetical protein DSCOOX_56320 [Desulfosarcina ovata subsp. ovata]